MKTSIVPVIVTAAVLAGIVSVWTNSSPTTGDGIISDLSTDTTSDAGKRVNDKERKVIKQDRKEGKKSGPTDDTVLGVYPGLDCSLVDDDTWGWGVDECLRGDTFTCMEYAKVYPSVWGVCNSSCSMGEVSQMKHDIDKTGSMSWNDDYHNSSWWVVCEWEVIRDLRSFCSGNFTAEAPDWSSRNSGSTASSFPGSVEITSSYDWDSCNVHAFCYVAMDQPNGKLNPYVKAVLEYYNTSSSPSAAKSNVFWHFEEWCQDFVLDSIEDGTFDPSIPLY